MRSWGLADLGKQVLPDIRSALEPGLVTYLASPNDTSREAGL